MPIFRYSDSRFSRLEQTSFEMQGILERTDLQTALREQIDIICPECLVIAEEFSEWADSRRRVDLLAVDKDANLIVVELKRTETGELMELQAIRYAAMVSTLTFRRAVEVLGDYLQRNGSEEDPEQKLLAFLSWEEPQEEDFALEVRITLVAADFSKELTTTVMWLAERGIDIRCVRLIPYRYGQEILVDVQQIIPLPEAESYQVRIRQQSEERREARRSQRDYTRYQFQGVTYNKRKLVLAVVRAWIEANKPETLADLLCAFPQETRRGGMFTAMEKANNICERQGVARHFLGEEEIIRFRSGEAYALSNQWGSVNMDGFIERARSLGLEIEPSG
jgi:hypothetical protein